MTFEEIIKELESYKDSEEFNNYIAGLMTDDRVKEYLNTDSGKKLLQPTLDSYFTKGLDTWKSNNLQSLVDEKVKELYPEADPKDTELAKVKAELEAMKAESVRKDLTNKALKYATEKGLPADLIDFFIGKDEETTNSNLKKLESIYSGSISSAVDKKLKENNYIPPEGTETVIDGVTAAFMKLNPELKITE